MNTSSVGRSDISKNIGALTDQELKKGEKLALSGGHTFQVLQKGQKPSGMQEATLYKVAKHLKEHSDELFKVESPEERKKLVYNLELLENKISAHNKWVEGMSPWKKVVLGLFGFNVDKYDSLRDIVEELSVKMSRTDSSPTPVQQNTALFQTEGVLSTQAEGGKGIEVQEEKQEIVDSWEDYLKGLIEQQKDGEKDGEKVAQPIKKRFRDVFGSEPILPKNDAQGDAPNPITRLNQLFPSAPPVPELSKEQQDVIYAFMVKCPHNLVGDALELLPRLPAELKIRILADEKSSAFLPLSAPERLSAFVQQEHIAESKAPLSEERIAILIKLLRAVDGNVQGTVLDNFSRASRTSLAQHYLNLQEHQRIKGNDRYVEYPQDSKSRSLVINLLSRYDDTASLTQTVRRGILSLIVTPRVGVSEEKWVSLPLLTALLSRGDLDLKDEKKYIADLITNFLQAPRIDPQLIPLLKTLPANFRAEILAKEESASLVKDYYRERGSFFKDQELDRSHFSVLSQDQRKIISRLIEAGNVAPLSDKRTAFSYVVEADSGSLKGKRITQEEVLSWSLGLFSSQEKPAILADDERTYLFNLLDQCEPKLLAQAVSLLKKLPIDLRTRILANTKNNQLVQSYYGASSGKGEGLSFFLDQGLTLSDPLKLSEEQWKICRRLIQSSNTAPFRDLATGSRENAVLFFQGIKATMETRSGPISQVEEAPAHALPPTVLILELFPQWAPHLLAEEARDFLKKKEQAQQQASIIPGPSDLLAFHYTDLDGTEFLEELKEASSSPSDEEKKDRSSIYRALVASGLMRDEKGEILKALGNRLKLDPGEVVELGEALKVPVDLRTKADASIEEAKKATGAFFENWLGGNRQ